MKEYNPILGALFSGRGGEGGYNAGFRQSRLAALYQGDDPEKQALAAKQLAAVDPESAGKWQQEQAKVAQQNLERKARMLASAPSLEVKQQLYSSIVPEVRKVWADAPDVYTPELDQMLTSWAGADGGNKSMPTDVQSIQWKLESAGYKPGSAEYKKALDVELGIAARPSSAAIAYKIVKGADGRERLIAVDPRTPGAMVMDGGTAGFGEPTATQEPKPSETDYNAIATNLQQVLRDAGFDEASARDVADAYHSRKSGEPKGQYTDGYVKPMPAGQSAAFVSRTPEEQAALTREAELKADLGLKPSIAAAESEAKFGVETRYAPGIAGASAEATAQGKARGERSATGEKKAAEAGDAIALLKEAEQILAGATGGYVGAKADEFAAAFGKSTKGAEANAQLNVIAPKLIGLVPRFEGPQSDADRKLYENAAGDLGNPNKPVSIRLAAARMMMKLYQKTADGKQSADGQTKRIRITL
jgi:hypothetical protein